MPDIADSSTQEEDNLHNNNRSSTDNTDDGSGSNDADDDMGHSLRSSSSVTLETSNQRGRSRKRSSRRKGNRRDLMRTKFEIESLYVEISQLKGQNETLRQIWENVQRTSQTQESFSKMHLNTQQQVPCAVQVSDASDVGHGSDLEISTSDRDSEGEWRKGGGNRKYKYTTEEDGDREDIHTLLYY
mmetsp:Transcript_1497/g.3168  ORF Transcript_1497/g.3168 Transcript_1497/m.3168 type:complete len:186 (+) Transcript_1497:108-665(+)|eukprot:CAMPEP_0172313038 /NCGR_PEP_ID=MMETSP1058-20130122/19188_1 /TAXON_ID=83371 /ORGANISM="Detonula confervacea, Strain CCMP 353" /LENGTH=185 /DNA_ID=CAMNT_0013026623 /DNA_START=35 /DNA_END=592 /DNA_ORIENTATION=+